jgi:LPS export ABC transporter protein LptC
MRRSSNHIYNLLHRLLVLPGVFFLLFSCENDIQKIQSLSNIEMPEVSAENIEIIYTDSAVMELKLKADKIKQYVNVDRPYIEFPVGVYVEFYDDSLNIETILKANHAFYFTEEKFWEAKGNVVVNNLAEFRKLNTEELFWDENKQIIYSNSYTKVETEDEVSYGERGFEADERFNKWKLKGYTGTINYVEEEKEAEKENEK